MRRLPLAFAFVLVPCLCFSQKSSVVPLIPAADWRLTSSQKVDLDAIRKWGGDPAIEREYTAKSVIDRTYSFENYTAEALFEQTQDPSSAYGLMTYYRTRAMVAEKDMRLTLSGKDGTVMARGPYFIRVSRPKNAPLPEMDFRALLIFIGGTSPSAASLEQLPAPLPARDLVAGSEKYVLGPEAAKRLLPSFPVELFDFQEGAEVQMATYSSSPSANSGATLLVASYPTPQIARLRYEAIEKALALNQKRGAASVYGRRQGTFVLLVLNSGAEAAATKFLDEFTVAKQVSWDQRYPGDKSMVLQMVELVLANMLLVAILIGFSLVGGTLVFVFKRFARKWHLRSAAGQNEEGGITVLGLDSLRYFK